MTDGLATEQPACLQPLRSVRSDRNGWTAGSSLGALGWGASAMQDDEGLTTVGLPLLWPPQAQVDAWRSDAPLQQGRSGAVRWRDDGHWRFGACEFDDHHGNDLAELSRQAYAAVFHALRDDDRLRLVRLWNYVPAINVHDAAAGLERYRLFNIGRQQAFVVSGQDAFEGAPAACALGTSGGPLCVRFLAARGPAVPVENPRQVPAYRYSTEFGPRSPTFSRAALANAGGGQVTLFISGTASVVGEQSAHVGDVQAQLQETLINLDALLQAAHAATTARFALAGGTFVVYLRHAEHLPAVREAFEHAVGHTSHAATSAVYLQADICRSDLLLEIEGHVHAPGELSS